MSKLEIKLILCPIDFSESSVRAYRHALSVAGHYQAKVAALHVVDLSQHPFLGFTAAERPYVELCRTLCENGEEQLKKFVEYEAELTLLHVLEKVPRPDRAAEAIAEATEQLEKLIPAKERKTLRIATAVRIGKAYEQIIQFALETEIDLAMMGVRGRDALDLAIFGSTTHRVMQLGPCPVLVAHV